MKKKISLILSVLLCLSLLAACGTASPVQETPPSAAPEAVPSEQPETAVASQPESAEPETVPSEQPEETPDPAAEAVWATLYGGDRYVGEWMDEVSQRASLSIIPTDNFGVYSVLLHWGSSADTARQWLMTASYEDAGRIHYTDGSCRDVTLHEVGDMEEQVLWEGSEGSFSLEAGKLRWEDNQEETSAELSFVRQASPVPSSAMLLDSCLKPVANLPVGTAGATLHMAKTAFEMLRFAQEQQIWNCDIPALRAGLQEAWAGLSPEEQTAFMDNIFRIHGAIVDSAVDWDSTGHLFEDAGVGDETRMLELDPTAMEGFYRLFDGAVAAGTPQG